MLPWPYLPNNDFAFRLSFTACWSVCAGRVQTILLFKLIGVNLMGFMGLYPEIWTKLGVIIPVYVVRTAIINSAYPLQKSILMDYVPKVSKFWSHVRNRHGFMTSLAESSTGTVPVLAY